MWSLALSYFDSLLLSVEDSTVFCEARHLLAVLLEASRFLMLLLCFEEIEYVSMCLDENFTMPLNLCFEDLKRLVHIEHCIQTDPAKNVRTRAYLIPERNRTVRRQEEGKNYVYLFVFCMNLGEINALLTISCCQMKHFGYVIVY